MPNTTQITTNRAIDESLTNLVKSQMEPKTFPSTGSKGFHCSDKFLVSGQRYQASAQAVLIGSKKNPKMRARATADQVQAAIIANLIEPGVESKNFHSGRTGYYGQGKIRVGDESYQAAVQAVLLVKK
jgi:hypothetical protein